MTADLIGKIAEQGILGVLLCLALIAYWLKDQQCTREKDARIADARALTEMALKLQQQAIDHVAKISEVFDELKRARCLR